jgi:hypothetical protein
MNTKYIFFIISFFSIFPFLAQEDNESFNEKLVLGLKIGGNYSNVYNARGEQFVADAKLGIVAGGFMSIPIGKYLGIQPEVLFSQKGFKATGVILGNTYKFTRTTSFIDVPLMVSFKPSSFLSILAGPQFSYLILQKNAFDSGTTSVAQETELINDNVRKNIMGFIGGIDININHIVIGLRAAADFQKNNGSGTAITPNYKNVWYQATIGFRF